MAASDLFTCPGCRAELELTDELPARLACSSCGSHYPVLGNIPVLFPRPESAIDEWRAGLVAFIEQTDRLTQQLAVELVEQAPAERARRRLSALVEGLPRHRDGVVELFERAGVQAGGEAEPWPLLSYFSLVHRDWAWVPLVDEVTPALDAIIHTLPDGFTLGNTIVLGAGTGKLGLELALRVPGGQSVLALDINPLPFLITQRLLDGEQVRVFEVPAHPLRSDRACVEHVLRPPERVPPGYRLVFADALEPPVRRGVFDTVLTPWFVDQVPPDLAVLPALVAQLLRDGGSWINHGPFVYDPARTKAAHRYCGDEFVQIVKAANFEITRCTYEPMSYMASPVSTQGRSERVLTMHARKRGAVEAKPQLPTWLEPKGGVEVVPRFEGIDDVTAPHPVVRRVAQLVNGQRTVHELARALVDEGLLADDGSAETAVRGCLKLLWQAARSEPPTA